MMMPRPIFWLLVADVGVSLAFGVGGGIMRLQGTTFRSASQRPRSSLLKMQDVDVLMMRCKLGSFVPACLPAKCFPKALAFTLHSRRGMLAATVCGALGVGQRQVVTASEMRVGRRGTEQLLTAHRCVRAHILPLTHARARASHTHTPHTAGVGPGQSC